MSPTSPTPHHISLRLEAFAKRIREVPVREQSTMAAAVAEIHANVALLVTGSQTHSPVVACTPGDSLCATVDMLRLHGPQFGLGASEFLVQLAECVDALFAGLAATTSTGES